MKIYRNTIQRDLVLNTVGKMKHHPTAEDVYEHISEEHPNISRSTVYRNLNILSEQGEIKKVQIPNAADRLDYKLKPHYHVVCRKCGKVCDLKMDYQEDLEKQITDAAGFLIEYHDIVFTGLCPDCK